MGRKTVYQAVDRTYEFDDHRVGYGYTRLVAVDVKYRGSYNAKLSDEYVRKLYIVTHHPDGHIEETLREWAEDDTRENWWEWAKDRAQELGLGPVHSEGRSGGWLVFDYWPVSGIETMCEATQDRCVHCDKEEEEHVNEQCLFASTYLELTPKLHQESREQLDLLEKCCAKFEESLKHIEQDYRCNLEHQIDRQFEDLNLEKKECEKPGQLTFWTSLPSSQLELPAIGNPSGR